MGMMYPQLCNPLCPLPPFPGMAALPFPTPFGPVPPFMGPMPGGEECKQYVVRAKLVGELEGGHPEGIGCPVVRMPEGQTASVSLASGLPGQEEPGRVDGMFQVRVTHGKAGKARVHLALDVSRVDESRGRGKLVHGEYLEATHTVPLGKTTRLVLGKDRDGQAKTWAVVEVEEVGQAGGVGCCGPNAACPACTGCGPEGRGKGLGRFCQTWEGGMTLPSPHHPPRPPQYFRSGPASPLPRELAAQEAVRHAVPAPCCLPHTQATSSASVVPCVATPARPGSDSVVRAVLEEGKAMLEVQGDARMTCKKMILHLPGCDPVRLTASGEHVVITGAALRGCADRVTAKAGGQVLMEGHVRVHCRQGQGAEVKGEAVTVDLKTKCRQACPEMCPAR